jgi:hypothetical protein
MTNEEINNQPLLTEPVSETTVQEPQSADFDKLSNREALKKSIEIHRSEQTTVDPIPTQKEVARSVEDDSPPPAEFSAEAKEAWRRKDIPAIQKEFRRIHDSRTAEIIRAQQAERAAREEGKTYRELAKMAAPYIEARGSQGVPPEKAIMEALSLVNEFKKADPLTVKAELKKIGIDLDKAPTSTAAASLDPKIEALQQTVEELKRDKEEQQFAKTVQTFDTIFQKLTSEKTRTGESVFPDLLDNSEKGIEFARELGSLTNDQRFQAGVLRRFPDADLSVVVREAYKFLGGRVLSDGSRVSPQKSQDHLNKSRRAAAAIPGRVAPRTDDSNLVGKLSNRAALEKALEIHRGR